MALIPLENNSGRNNTYPTGADSGFVATFVQGDILVLRMPFSTQKSHIAHYKTGGSQAFENTRQNEQNRIIIFAELT